MVTSDVFLTPASPATSTSRPRPARTSEKAPCSTARSSSRSSSEVPGDGAICVEPAIPWIVNPTRADCKRGSAHQPTALRLKSRIPAAVRAAANAATTSMLSAAISVTLSILQMWCKPLGSLSRP
jgi:hypothetical protein